MDGFTYMLPWRDEEGWTMPEVDGYAIQMTPYYLNKELGSELAS
jgi:hypothetical protein